jgi:hypothetical protein
MQRKAIWLGLVLSLVLSSAHAGACEDKDGDGYGVYPNTSKLNGCTHDGIDCDDSDPDVHPFATEVCGNGKDDNCRHGVDEGCGAPAAFDGWRVMPVRSEGEFSRGELGGRAEQWLQGATRCIADPNVIYLSHDCSVIWRSRDGGQTWEKPLSHGLLLAHGQSIEVDPVDCNRVLIVAAEAWNYKHAGFTGIYLSEDGGDHFDYVQNGPAYNSRRYEHDIAFSPSSADAQGALVWYAALYEKAGEPDVDQAGLYRSNDRGRTWERHASLSDHNPVYEVQVSPSSSETLLLASNKGLFRSTDGGVTLQPVGNLPTGSVTSVAFSPTDATTIYAVLRESSANGLYRSTNGGDTFVRLQSSDSLHQSVLDDARRIFVHPKKGDVFHVIPQSGTGGRTAIRTENAGTSFSTASISLPDDIKAWRWGLNISGNFAFLLMSATDDKQVVAQSGGAALYRSSDGDLFVNGSTLYTGANCGGQNYSIAFDRDDPQRLVVAHQDIGVYMTENGGNFFVSRSVPHAWVGQNLISWSSQWTVDIHPTQKNQFVSAVGSSFDRKIVRTTNSGSEWTLPESQSGNYFRVVHHPYDGNLVLAGNLRSQNGGTSFSPIPFPAALSDGAQVMDLCRSNPDVVYAASRTTRRILRSEDKGQTWSQYVQAGWSLAPFDPYFTFAVDPVDCGVVYTVDGDGDLARYDGSAWTSLGVLAKVTPPAGYFTYVRAVMVDPNHPEVLYAGLFGAGLPSMFRSTDTGATWEDVSFNRFREGFGGINISPHSGEVFVGGCSGTWVLPPPYPTNHGIYDNLVSRPSCIDGIQNGEEQGIDCGGTCPTACEPGGEPLPDGGVAGSGGSGGSSSGGSGGSGGSSGGVAGNSGSDPGTDAGTGTGGSVAGADDGSSSDGCGCRTASRGNTLLAGWLLLLSMLGAGMRLIRKS